MFYLYSLPLIFLVDEHVGERHERKERFDQEPLKSGKLPAVKLAISTFLQIFTCKRLLKDRKTDMILFSNIMIKRNFKVSFPGSLRRKSDVLLKVVIPRFFYSLSLWISLLQHVEVTVILFFLPSLDRFVLDKMRGKGLAERKLKSGSEAGKFEIYK